MGHVEPRPGEDTVRKWPSKSRERGLGGTKPAEPPSWTSSSMPGEDTLSHQVYNSLLQPPQQVKQAPATTVQAGGDLLPSSQQKRI